MEKCSVCGKPATTHIAAIVADGRKDELLPVSVPRCDGHGGPPPNREAKAVPGSPEQTERRLHRRVAYYLDLELPRDSEYWIGDLAQAQRDLIERLRASDRGQAEVAIRAAVAEEREMCAKVCEDIKARWVNEETADMIAAAIRARADRA